MNQPHLKQTLSNSHGFSLLELAVVIIIITLLASFAVPYYLNAVETARSTEAVVLWGQTKNFNVGRFLSEAQAQSLQKRINEEGQLKKFNVQLVCRETTSGRPCWELEFIQKELTPHIHYKLATVSNMTRLGCVGLNPAGKNFCLTQSGQDDETATQAIGEEQGFIIKG